MSLNPLEIKNPYTYTKSQASQYNTTQSNKKNIENNNLQGVLLNNFIKKQSAQADIENFDRISSSLLIPEEVKAQPELNSNDKKGDFDAKKLIKPLAAAAVASIGMIALISGCVKNYSKLLSSKADLVRPEDLAININLLEESDLGLYKFLRDPNAKNLAGFIGVILMSAVGVICKNFVQGVREIWVKKQNCDIEHDLAQNLIQVETDVFSGKLNVVNTMLTDTTKYFKSVFSDKKNATNFKSFLSFKGKEDSREDKENKEEKEKPAVNFKTIALIAGGVAGICLLSYSLLKNYRKTLENFDSYVEKFQNCEIEAEIQKAIKSDDKESAIVNLSNILKRINANDSQIKENLNKIKGITPKEVEEASKEIKKAQIYVNTPETLGGITGKTQYYCYINEPRGHLYNWILNPENKFNKYIFLSITALTSAGFIGQEAIGAIKEVAVGRENAKSELNLRKRLVDVEINNFKAKKMSAVNPMIDNFIIKLEKNKPKEELKELAENILVEIKNGPPYVYS